MLTPPTRFVTLITIATVLGFASCAQANPHGQLSGAQPTASPSLSSLINTTVHVTEPAVRGDRSQELPFPSAPPFDGSRLAECDAHVLGSLVHSEPTANQWIVVLAPSITSTTATVQIATRGADNAWRCSLAPTIARLGRNGIRPLADRRSGDDTTPSGVFGLGVVNSPQGPISFFGNSPDPGARGAYRHIQPDDCYGAEPNTPGYGHWRSDTTTCSGADELLHGVGAAYEHAVLIGANTEPNVSGDSADEPALASAIFLHRFSYTASGATKATSGCVSIAHQPLLIALRTIDPSLNPRFAIGTAATLTTR